MNWSLLLYANIGRNGEQTMQCKIAHLPEEKGKTTKSPCNMKHIIALGRRAILLENQSENEQVSPSTWLRAGIFSFACSASSNQNLARQEVRLELGLFL